MLKLTIKLRHPFIPQTFAEHLLCARHFARYWGSMGNKTITPSKQLLEVSRTPGKNSVSFCSEIGMFRGDHLVLLEEGCKPVA